MHRSTSTIDSALILTADTGSGHRTNVSAIKGVLSALSVQVDVCAGIESDAALRHLPGAYRWLNVHAPRIFALYFASRKTTVGFRANRHLARWRLRSVLDLLSHARPDVVVIAHSIYCHALDALAATSARVVVVVVDLSGGPSEWFQPGAHLYVVQSEAARSLALAGGVPSEAIVVRRVLPPSARRRLLDSEDRSSQVTRLLIVGGGDGVGPILETVAAIQKSRPSLEISVVCGTNDALADSLRALPQPISSVQGYVPNLAEQFADFDLVITKPGSVTVIALLYERVPFVLMRGIPGVEESNERLITRESGLPVIFNSRSASETIEYILTPDLRLSSAGVGAFAALSRFGATLPQQMVAAEEILGVPR